MDARFNGLSPDTVIEDVCEGLLINPVQFDRGDRDWLVDIA